MTLTNVKFCLTFYCYYLTGRGRKDLSLGLAEGTPCSGMVRPPGFESTEPRRRPIIPARDLSACPTRIAGSALQMEGHTPVL